MARSVKGGEPHEQAVEADTGALGAVPDAGAPEEAGAAPEVAWQEASLNGSLAEWDGYEVEALLVRGYFEEKLSREHVCVLGRRAVSATHECLGEKCAAWRWGPPCRDKNRIFGFCGLAGML